MNDKVKHYIEVREKYENSSDFRSPEHHELCEQMIRLEDDMTGAERAAGNEFFERRRQEQWRAREAAEAAQPPEVKARKRMITLTEGFRQLAKLFSTEAGKTPDLVDALAWGRLRRACEHTDAAARIHYFSAVYVDEQSDWGTWIAHIQKLAHDLNRLAIADLADIPLDAMVLTNRYLALAYEYLGLLHDQLSGASALQHIKSPPAGLGGENTTHAAVEARRAGVTVDIAQAHVVPALPPGLKPIRTEAEFQEMIGKLPVIDMEIPDGKQE